MPILPELIICKYNAAKTAPFLRFSGDLRSDSIKASLGDSLITELISVLMFSEEILVSHLT